MVVPVRGTPPALPVPLEGAPLLGQFPFQEAPAGSGRPRAAPGPTGLPKTWAAPWVPPPTQLAAAWMGCRQSHPAPCRGQTRGRRGGEGRHGRCTRAARLGRGQTRSAPGSQVPSKHLPGPLLRLNPRGLWPPDAPSPGPASPSPAQPAAPSPALGSAGPGPLEWETSRSLAAREGAGSSSEARLAARGQLRKLRVLRARSGVLSHCGGCPPGQDTEGGVQGKPLEESLHMSCVGSAVPRRPAPRMEGRARGSQWREMQGAAPRTHVHTCSGLGPSIPCMLTCTHMRILCTRMLTHIVHTHTHSHSTHPHSSVWHTLIHSHSHVHTLVSYVH